MNITEFAAYAGVSKAAVSRFFNGGYLSAEKKAAIAKAVEETGYRPSMQTLPKVCVYVASALYVIFVFPFMGIKYHRIRR